MNAEQILAFDGVRDLSRHGFRSACYAPATSMYFDVRGNVIACCQSTANVLGNVNETSLDEIWSGAAAVELRAALARYELPRGCEFCAWQIEDGNYDGMFSTLFDQYPVEDHSPAWPVQMEFALSNVCNLQCVMCSGDFSSAIRSRREKRPPLPLVYGEGFFAQLGPFLERLRVARFFGGEPFLVPEYQRIWDLMVEVGSPAVCNVTTNGTVRTARVEAALAALPFSIGVSVDGFSRETVESVRVGADFDVVMGNVAWFRRYCSEQGTGFGLTYCLMTVNWQEFADFLAFADDLDAAVAVNTVTYPSGLSLYRIDADELRSVIEGMERQDPALGVNASVWSGELDRLRNWEQRLDARRGVEAPSEAFFERSPFAPALVEGAEGPPLTFEGARERISALGSGLSVLHTDPSDVVVGVEGGEGFLGVAAHDIIGRSFVEALARLQGIFGQPVGLEEVTVAPNAVYRVATFERDGRLTRIPVVQLADEAGATTSIAVIAAVGAATPVAPPTRRP